MNYESIRCSQLSVFKFRAVVIIFILFGFASAQGVVLPETAKLVGPETVLLVNINNFTELNSQFEKTTLYKFYKDPSMTGFIEDIQKKVQEKADESGDEITKGLFDAEILPKGRLAIALGTGKEVDVAGPSVLVISQWGENVGKIKEVIEKQVSKAVEDDARRKSESFRSVDIVTIIKERPAEEVPDWGSYKPEHNDVPMKTFQPPPVELSYSFIDDCLVGSTDIEMLKFAIAHIQGAESASLADEANYGPTMKALGPYHDIDLYVNLNQLIKTTIAGDPSGQAQMMMTSLGLDNITALGCSIGLARRPDSSCSGKVLLKVNGAKKGICKMLDFESATIKAPQFIPAEAYSTMFVNLNIKNLYGELQNILSMFNPMIVSQLNQPLFAGPDGEGG